MPSKKSKPVTVRKETALQRVRKAWGKEYDKSDTAYEFSNGRRFESSDRGTSGFYR